jgi:hypothetical protein
VEALAITLLGVSIAGTLLLRIAAFVVIAVIVLAWYAGTRRRRD